MAPASYVTLVLLSFLLRDRFSGSGRPRWSIGRATASVFAPIADLEPRLDFGERVEREMCHADSRPRSPNAAAMRSEAPFIACDRSSKLVSTLKEPPSRTTWTTLSKSPTAACTWARRLIAHSRAASLASSIDECEPSLPTWVGEM